MKRLKEKQKHIDLDMGIYYRNERWIVEFTANLKKKQENVEKRDRERRQQEEKE